MALHQSITNQTKVSLKIAEHLFLKESEKNKSEKNMVFLKESEKNKSEKNMVFLKESEKNMVFSPLLLQIVLSLIAAGSEGPTKQQLLYFLRSRSIDELSAFVSHLVSTALIDGAPAGGPHLSCVNGVWLEKTLPLLPSFEQIMSTDYKATLTSVDFLNKADEVVNEVNLWVEKETNYLIKELLPSRSVTNQTSLIFANALYFKGAWDQKFDVSQTRDYDFRLLNGRSVKVPFMTSTEKQCIGTYDDFKVLRLPYKKGEDERRFSMYLFLPNAKNGLSALIKKVTSKPDLLTNFRNSRLEVGDCRIPKFNISFGLETTDMLKDLGVDLPFIPGGLTKMVDSNVGQEVFVSKIFQKSVIKVEEEEEEEEEEEKEVEKVEEEDAEAADGWVTITRARPRPRSRLHFVADHPFLFLVREDWTETILFIGQVLNPLLSC